MEQQNNITDNSFPNNTELPKNNSDIPYHSKNIILIALSLAIVVFLVFSALFLARSKKTTQNKTTLPPITSTPTITETYQNTKENIFLPNDLNTVSLSEIMKNIYFEFSQDDRYKYTVILKDSSGKILKERIIDVSKLGWDLGLLERGIYPFNQLKTEHNSYIIYNPNTDTLILPLVYIPGGIAGNKPEGVLPDPPYTIAIYTTTFNNADKLHLIYSSEDVFDLRGYNIDLNKNVLYLSAADDNLYALDLNKNSIKSLMSNKVHAYIDAYEQINYGDLFLSRDMRHLIQYFHYNLRNPPSQKEGYILFDLENNRGEYKFLR